MFNFIYLFVWILHTLLMVCVERVGRQKIKPVDFVKLKSNIFIISIYTSVLYIFYYILKIEFMPCSVKMEQHKKDEERVSLMVS